MDQAVQEELVVVTFNVLAPCYNPKEGGRHAAVNLLNSRQWQERHRSKVVSAIAQLQADVVCLQEFWFTPTFLSLYETEMARLGYQAVTMRRTRRKEDGVATFVLTDRLDIVASHQVGFADAGDRVALLTGALFAVVNTHLTFPHNDFDLRMRRQQAAKIIKSVELYLLKDFNGTKEDEVYFLMERAGYASSFFLHNGREVGVTHHNHRDEDVGVDFIFVKNFTQESADRTGHGSSTHNKSDMSEEETESVAKLAHVPKQWLDEFTVTLSTVEGSTAVGDCGGGSWELQVLESWAHPMDQSDEVWLRSFEDTSDHRPVVSRLNVRRREDVEP